MLFECHVCGNNVSNLYSHLRVVHCWPRLKSELKAMKGLNQCKDEQNCEQKYLWEEDIAKHLLEGNVGVDCRTEGFDLVNAKIVATIDILKQCYSELHKCAHPEYFVELERSLQNLSSNVSEELYSIADFVLKK